MIYVCSQQEARNRAEIMNTQTSRSSYAVITSQGAHLLERVSTIWPFRTAAAIFTSNPSILFVQETSMCVYRLRVR
jgi:hypothetical protein